MPATMIHTGTVNKEEDVVINLHANKKWPKSWMNLQCGLWCDIGILKAFLSPQ